MRLLLIIGCLCVSQKNLLPINHILQLPKISKKLLNFKTRHFINLTPIYQIEKSETIDIPAKTTGTPASAATSTASGMSTLPFSVSGPTDKGQQIIYH